MAGQLPQEGGTGNDEDVARRRAEQLAEIDPDWNPGVLGWAVDWQRTYAAVAGLEEIVPGVTADGVDVGRSLQRQQRPSQPGRRTGAPPAGPRVWRRPDGVVAARAEAHRCVRTRERRPLWVR